jgi:hypothetical protein
MSHIQRLGLDLLDKRAEQNTVLMLYGPRRSGKTTLLHEWEAGLIKKDIPVKWVNGETALAQTEFLKNDIEPLKAFVGEARVLIIDEAQAIPEIGVRLKLMVDHLKDLIIVASGSASLSLAQKVGEPLTGRKKTMHLYPISGQEVIRAFSTDQYKTMLDQMLIFGGYPHLFELTSQEEKRLYLQEMADSVLFKDILTLERIRSPRKLRDLLTLLAFQIGKEVSLNELGSSLDLAKETVFRYLDLLEKAFVLVNIRGFSRNLRKEVTKTSRYYFYDNGIRNAIINNFNPLGMRDDVGMLWENYLVMERLKKQHYEGLIANNYFWRTYDQKEIDWVEERDGRLFGYEIKWGTKLSAAPKDFLGAYNNATFTCVNRNNFLDFIT